MPCALAPRSSSEGVCLCVCVYVRYCETVRFHIHYPLLDTGIEIPRALCNDGDIDDDDTDGKKERIFFHFRNITRHLLNYNALLGHHRHQLSVSVSVV